MSKSRTEYRVLDRDGGVIDDELGTLADCRYMEKRYAQDGPCRVEWRTVTPWVAVPGEDDPSTSEPSLPGEAEPNPSSVDSAVAGSEGENT